MIYGIVIVCIVQLAIAQETRLGAAATEVVVPIVYVAEACHATVMQSWAHVGIVPLAVAQDTVAPLGALVVDMVSAVLLAFTAVEPPLTLTLPAI
jgi:hypothetical protein